MRTPAVAYAGRLSAIIQGSRTAWRSDPPTPSRGKIDSAMAAVKKVPAGNGGRHRRPNPIGGCPLTAALAAIGGKWKLIIVYWLAESPKHFAALRQAMPGISQKV